MISALVKALGQMPEPAFRSVMLRALGWSMALFASLLAFTWWLIVATRLFGIDWLEWIADAIGGFAAVVVAVLLFPGAVLIVISFLLDDIARAVEVRYYPDLPPPRDQPVMEAVWVGLRFAAVAVILNLFMLPLYFFPVLNVFVFTALNGYLLGREYFELIAARRLDAAAMRAMRRRHRSRLWIAGIVITFLLAIPVVNWFMPVVAAAFMLHIFQKIHASRLPSRAGKDPVGKP